MTLSRLRQKLAQTEASTLSLRARQLAAGWAAGSHRAERKGSGVEFAGHRAYTPGDDLRHLDRHALLRHQRLLVREFLTDTERSIQLVVDVTRSMAYGDNATGEEAQSKAQLALLLAAALGFIAQGNGDRLGLTTVGESDVFSVKPRAGRESFERIMHHLEKLDDQTHTSSPSAEGQTSTVTWHDTFDALGAALPRGTIIFVLSDFLDLGPDEHKALGALSTDRRTVRAAQILTRDEIDFPFEGTVRLRDPETGKEVETEGASVRKDYVSRLASLTDSLRDEVEHQGGFFVRLETSNAAEVNLRALAAGETMAGGGQP